MMNQTTETNISDEELFEILADYRLHRGLDWSREEFMPINLAGAYTPQAQRPSNEPKLEMKDGAYQGFFIGLGEPYNTYDRFKGCKSCGLEDPKSSYNRLKGPGCKVCGMTGMLPVKEVALKYRFKNGKPVQEAVNYKLSGPRTLGGGRSISGSKLYDRFKSISGLENEIDIISWGENLPDEPEIPVTLIIKSKNGFSKISDVIGAAPVMFHPQENEDETPF